MKLTRLTVKIVALLIMSVVAFSGCIKSEAKNAEADIIKILIDVNELRATPTINNNSAMILVYKNTDITNISLEFELTPGATINPESGTPVDFSDEATGEQTGGKNTQKYVVTSQDGQWNKTYLITITAEDIPTHYTFEHWEQLIKYEIPYEPIYPDNLGEGEGETAKEHIQLKIWSSGNAGYGLINNDGPNAFPTCSSGDSQEGALAAKLETKLTGHAPLPLAAGNLYLGSFNARIAMETPMEATRFGVPFNQKPKALTGYYKYKSGKDYKIRVGTGASATLKTVPEREYKDKCDIYAVLYYKNFPNTEDKDTKGNPDKGNSLHGGNIKSSDRVVAFAQVETVQSGEYIQFDVEFDYNAKYLPFDKELMKNYEYYLALVFSASEDGASFVGAPGSIMYVDNVRIECFESEE